MGTDVTKDDLWDLRDTLTEQIREGFRGVHARQDTTNGRIQKAEVALAEYGVKVKNLEREVFPPSGGRRKVDPVARPKGYVSERDVRVVLATLGTTGGVIAFFWKLLPAILRAVTP